MGLTEHTEDYVRNRLLELGFKEPEVDNGMIEARTADAIYFWRKGLPDVVIKFESGRWFMQE